MTSSLVLLLLGFATLIAGGEFLLRGAIGVAKKFKLSSLVIGMTVVAFGTSMPELIVSIKSALQGHPEIAIGGVVGSNIANLTLVLGLTALVFPIMVARSTKIIDWPKMMYAVTLMLLFAWDGVLEMWEGVVLLVSLIVFVWYIVMRSRKSSEEKITGHNSSNISKTLMYLLVGFVGLYFGSEWLLIGAVDLARDLGLTEHVIGITVIALGTSVPELVTSCVAAFKKETDISIGNLIGSNIFNISAVLGITAIVHPIEINNDLFNFDVYWLVGIPLLVLAMMYNDKIGRANGGLLLIMYVTYITITLVR